MRGGRRRSLIGRSRYKGELNRGGCGMELEVILCYVGWWRRDESCIVYGVLEVFVIIDVSVC